MLDAMGLGVRSSDGAAGLRKGEKSSNGSHDTQKTRNTRHDAHRRPSNILKERVSAETFGRQRSICHHHQI